MSPKFCIECGETLLEVAKFCSGCGEKVETSAAVAENSEPEGATWIFSRHNTSEYDNIKEDLRNHLENHKIGQVRKYFAKGLELHFPEVLEEKLMGDDDEKAVFSHSTLVEYIESLPRLIALKSAWLKTLVPI